MRRVVIYKITVSMNHLQESLINAISLWLRYLIPHISSTILWRRRRWRLRKGWKLYKKVWVLTLVKWNFAGFRLVCQFQNHHWTRFKPQELQKITSWVTITWLLLKYIETCKMVLELTWLHVQGTIKLRDNLRI